MTADERARVDLLDQWQCAYEYWLSANGMVNRAMLAGNETERLWWIAVANERADRCDEYRRAVKGDATLELCA